MDIGYMYNTTNKFKRKHQIRNFYFNSVNHYHPETVDRMTRLGLSRERMMMQNGITHTQKMFLLRTTYVRLQEQYPDKYISIRDLATAAKVSVNTAKKFLTLHNKAPALQLYQACFKVLSLNCPKDRRSNSASTLGNQNRKGQGVCDPSQAKSLTLVTHHQGTLRLATPPLDDGTRLRVFQAGNGMGCKRRPSFYKEGPANEEKEVSIKLSSRYIHLMYNWCTYTAPQKETIMRRLMRRLFWQRKRKDGVQMPLDDFKKNPELYPNRDTTQGLRHMYATWKPPTEEETKEINQTRAEIRAMFKRWKVHNPERELKCQSNSTNKRENLTTQSQRITQVLTGKQQPNMTDTSKTGLPETVASVLTRLPKYSTPPIKAAS